MNRSDFLELLTRVDSAIDPFLGQEQRYNALRELDSLLGKASIGFESDFSWDPMKEGREEEMQRGGRSEFINMVLNSSFR